MGEPAFLSVSLSPFLKNLSYVNVPPFHPEMIIWYLVTFVLFVFSFMSFLVEMQ